MAKETYVDKLKMQIGVASAKVRADNYFPLIGDTVTMNAETRWGQTSGWQLDTGTGTTNEDGNLTNQKDSHQVTVANDGELQQKFTVENYLTEAEVFKTLYAMQPQALPYFDIETTEVARVGDTFTLKTVPENGYALACTGVCRIYKENETESPSKTLTLSPGTGTSVLETSVSFSEASERGIYDVEVDVTDTASGVTLSKRVNKLITVVPKLCPKPADTSTGYEVASTYKAQTSYSEGKSLDFPIKLWRNVDGSGLNYAELILPRGDEENSRWDIEADISALPAGTTLCLKKDPNEPESYPFRFFPSGNSNHNNTNENGTKNFTYAEPLVVTHDCEDVFEWTWRSYGAVNVGWNSHNVILDGYGYHNTGIHFKVFDTRLSYDSCFFLCNGTSDWEMFGCDIDGAGFAGILAYDKIKNKWISIPIMLAIAVVGKIVRVDYGWYGILFIYIFYIFKNKQAVILPTSIALVVTYYATIYKMNFFHNIIYLQILFILLSLIPIYMYNGEKGRSLKKFFYLFYPVHLLIVYLIYFMKI